MADLQSLIRLRKHTVDQKQKFLAGLYRQADILEQKKAGLQDALTNERKLLEEQEMLEALAWYGRYAQGVKTQIDLLNKDIKHMEQRIEIARTDLREAFAEMKKIEITARQREEAERKEENDRESRELDEIGIEGHRRKEDESK